MRPLVERSTLSRVYSLKDSVTRKNNGENLVRLILIVMVFFVILTIATK